MRLHIVQPTTYTQKGKLYQTRKRRLMGLTLPYLAALTPRGIDVTLTDERLSSVDFTKAFDLVAITVWTRLAPRAYEIAEAYRKRGIPVIMGGPHTYFYSEEVQGVSDSIFIGEAEELWGHVLTDATKGSIKGMYRVTRFPELCGLPFPRYELLDLTRYPRPRVFQVQTTRGCPFRCNFCEESVLFGRPFRSRPVEEVLEEIRYIKTLGGKFVYFIDSVFAGTKTNTLRLMERLIPLKVRWAALWSMNHCHDEDLVSLAKKSGCMHLNMGMESINPTTIKGMKKRQNKTQHYHDALNLLKKAGISYSLNFVFGWDTDGPEVFNHTLNFLDINRVPMAFFNLLSPRKGTGIYEKLLKEGRLLDERNLNRRVGLNCQFRPLDMEPEDLISKVYEIHRRFYSLPSIVRRCQLRPRLDSWGMLVFNLFQWQQCRKAGFGNLDLY